MEERPDWLSEVLTILEFMPAGREQSWCAGLAKLYVPALCRLGAEWATAAAKWAVDNEPWRPSVARLRQIAAELASPVPAVDAAYAEMLEAAAAVGLYGRRVMFERSEGCGFDGAVEFGAEGAPEFSHPLIAQAVRQCGGWRSICSGEANLAEGLSKQFRAAYVRTAELWTSEVAEVLALPNPREQRPDLFPAPRPALPPKPVLRIRPAEYQPKIAPTAERSQIGRTMPGGRPGPVEPTAEQPAAAEASKAYLRQQALERQRERAA